MATEVLLMANVPDLGAEGDVVKVADGYARNYLLPKVLAAPVSEATRRQLGKLRRDRETEHKEQRETAKKLAAKLGQTSCTITVKTGANDQMYGSVGASDIVAALAELGIEIDRHAIDLEHPIKEVGRFEVGVKLDPEVTASVKVWVVEE